MAYQNHRSKRRGSMSVEFGLLSPLLMLMMVGAADFARIFYHAITISNAAEVGSLWGTQGNVQSVSYDAINTVVTNDASDLSGVTPDAAVYCDCPDGQEVSCTEGDCGAYGLPRLYSQVTATQTFEPIVPWPGIPNPVVITRTTYIRVQ